MDLKHLIRESIVDYVTESDFEMIEVLELDEAINTFNDLPRAWKRRAANSFENKGGKDSKVEVLAATRKIKDVRSITNVLRKALRRDGAALVWIEMNGEPFVAVNKNSYENKYMLLYPSGDFVTKTVREKMRGTDKYDTRLQKYIPPKYWERKESSLRPTEAADKMWDVAFQTLEKMNSELDDPRDSVFDFAREMKFEVRIMYPDVKRAEKRAERKDTRAGMDSSLMKNRKVAIERMVRQKITPLIDNVKSQVDVQVNNALEGKNFDFKEVENALRRIGDVTGRLQRILKSDEVRLKKAYWNTEKAQLDYDLRRLMNDLKELDK